MPQATFPDPDPDPDPDAGDAEPGGFPPDEDAPGPEQGLYITLPAEHLTLAGFNQGGASDTMAPGALLATVVDTVTGQDGSGLAGCSDDQLMGIISAARRQQSRDAWTLMAAIAEFARRAGAGSQGEFAADELAFELHMSQPSAAGQMDFATDGRQAAAQDLRRAGRRADPPDPPADHRRRDPHPDRRGRRQGRRDPGRGRPRHDVRRAPVRRPQAGPEAGPRRGPQAQGSRQARSPRAPVPGGVRQRRHGRPRAPLRRGPGLLAARRAARPGPARRRRPRHPARPARPRLP